jgi:hypothetical protein
LEEVAVHRAAHERWHGQHRQRENDGEREQVRRGQARHCLRPRYAGLDQHAVLKRRADGAAARRDLRHTVGRELRRRHGVPLGVMHGDAL